MIDPNIILIVMDSVRADKLSCYGYEKPTTPNLDSLAEECTVYTQAITEAPWTVPAHVTLFTGLYPWEHRIESATTLGDVRIPKGVATIPDVLSSRKYATVGLSSNPWIGRLSRLNMRFDTFVEDNLNVSKGSLEAEASWLLRTVNKSKYATRAARKVARMCDFPWYDHIEMTEILVKTLKKWIIQHKQQGHRQPFFAFANFMNAHNPYFPRQKHLDKLYPGLQTPKLWKFNDWLAQYIRGDEQADQEARDIMHALYDANLRALDEHIGSLVTFLKEENLLEHTLLVILSDHGKTLGEHDRRSPLHYITDTNIHIPLLVRYPGAADNTSVSSVVQLSNVFNTVLEAANVDSNPNFAVTQETLAQKAALKNQFAYTRVVVPYMGESTSEPIIIRSVKQNQHKLVLSKKHGTLLLNKAMDPQESVDFSTKDPAKVQELRNAIKRTYGPMLRDQ